jgi:hypothetical protein
MAKSSTVKSGGSARIRFVIIDAEIPDGDIGSVTQVIQNALRSPATIVQRVAGPNGTKTIAHNPVPAYENEAEEEIDDAEEIDSAPQPARQRTTRKAPTSPDIVDIEMNADMSFAAFAQDKDAKSQHKKYLIAAAWLKEHRNIDAVTDGHIYTCFRSIGWSTNIADFAQPLRELKSKKYFTTPERGHYAINHIGLDYVKKLGGGNGTG